MFNEMALPVMEESKGLGHNVCHLAISCPSLRLNVLEMNFG
jgi:hypothetical protein